MQSTAKVPIKGTSSSIEKFGLESVPKELRQTKWYDYFLLQVAFSVNSGNFLVPALAVINGGLSFYAAVLSTVFGAAAAFLFVSLLTYPGSKNGIPSQYAIRCMIGTWTARYIASPIRSLTSLYWFAVQTIGGSVVLVNLAEKVFSINIPFLPVSIGLAILMSVLAVVGFEAVKKAIRYFLPFLVVGQFILFFLLIKEALLSDTEKVLFHHDWSLSTFVFYSSLAFVQYVSGVSASSDMARYASSPKGAFWGLYSGNTFGFILTAILGALSASLLGEWNPFVSVSSLTSSSLILIFILICAMASMISINLNNAYTGGFSLLNTFQSLGRIKSAIVFGIGAVLLSCFPSIVDQAQSYISLLGAAVIPISAVIVADFLFIKRGSLTEEHLEDLVMNRLTINKVALLSILLGISLYTIIPAEKSPGFITFMLVVALYTIIMKKKLR